jgi:D-alanyl-D-alanine carboxypeptidase
MGSLVANEKISVESLLSAMLIESSNDAAVALAENFSNSGQASFAELMNRKASQLNLEISRFSDPSGLSYENISSAAEVAKMIQSSAEYQILRELTTIEETDIRSTDGKYNHHLVNSNKLLKKYPEIIIGKTGYIDEAGQCIALAIKPPRGEGMIINVILGSPDRLFEMEKLILWEKKAFLW